MQMGHECVMRTPSHWNRSFGTATSCQDLTGWPPEDVVLLAHLRLQRMIHCTESLLVAMCLEWKLTEKSPDVSPDEPQLQMILIHVQVACAQANLGPEKGPESMQPK